MDIVYRLGRKSATDRSRLIIVQFTSRSVRDKIWKDAKSSDYLRRNNYRILEDLSLNMKEEHNKLWPLVKRARDEGKRAGFRGAFTYVEGKKNKPIEVNALTALQFALTYFLLID